MPFQLAGDAFERLRPKAVILSGGPASVMRPARRARPTRSFQAGIPISRHLLRAKWPWPHSLAARRASDHREFGRAMVEVAKDSPIFDGRLGERRPDIRCG